jgi:hypothetical protein
MLGIYATNLLEVWEMAFRSVNNPIDIQTHDGGVLDDQYAKADQVGVPVGAVVLSKDLGPDPEAPFAMFASLPAGYVIPRHAHATPRIEVIIKGSIDVGDQVLLAGDIMIQAAGEYYGPHTAGPEGALTAEFCAKVKDFPAYTADGSTMTDAFLLANDVTKQGSL